MSLRGTNDIRAIWFGDEGSLIGHVHTPRGAALDLAVVICPTPFGYDNVCSHRALRVLGDRLAAGGMAVLRFDFPGTGDSDGEHGIPAWKAAVAAAVATARRETGCVRVALVGVGLGGTVALARLDEGLDVDRLILWGTPTRGRTWLRQQRAFQRVTGVKPNPAMPPPPPPPDGVEELSGFPLTRALADELTALDVGQGLAWPVDRPRPVTLLLSRAAGDPDPALAGALDARGIPAATEAYDGFEQMFEEPHLAKAPEAIFARMREWLGEGAGARAPFAPVSTRAGVATRIGKDGLVEELARYTPGDGGLLFSIETRPAGRDPHPTWIVFLTGRAVRHIGPNRIWVRFARTLAAAGYASLRLDGRSVGDSDGEGNGLMPNAEYYQEHIYDDIERVMQVAVDRGAKQFLMTGICSGATGSYQVAWRRSDVRAIVMLNPLQLRHDPEDDDDAKAQWARRWGLRKALWTDPRSYLRLLRGELPSKKMLKAVFSVATLLSPFRRNAAKTYVVDGFRKLADKPVDIDIFLSEGDLSVLFLERHFGTGLVDFERKHLRVHRVHHTDHTLRPLFSQERFFELLRTSLSRIAPG